MAGVLSSSRGSSEEFLSMTGASHDRSQIDTEVMDILEDNRTCRPYDEYNLSWSEEGTNHHHIGTSFILLYNFILL